MYPSGHPSLGPAIDTIVQRTSRLLQDRPSIAFGIARRQLVIEGVATDPDQPVLARLAEGLHGHRLGAISILRGVPADEMAEAVRALATEPGRDGALGISRERPGSAWPHVKLHPLTFTGLTLVGDAPISTEGSGGEGDVREAELWIGLARAALSVDDLDQAAPVATEPTVVARAIDEHPSAAAYDQVIIGFLLQIARELRSTTGGRAPGRPCRACPAARPHGQ